MSTNTRVLRNITNFKVWNLGGTANTSANATVITSIRRVMVNDATGEIVAGSDNDAAPKKFNSWYNFNGSLECEDPVVLAAVKGFQNAYVTFTAVDINGVGNCNVSCTGTRFSQVGLPSAEYGQEALASCTIGGGEINIVAA